MLQELELLPVYDSADTDLVRDLIVPLLENSVYYTRGVGFFTSGWLRVASHGLVPFVENGGRPRIVLSPVLEERDWEAFKLGDRARKEESLRQVLSKGVADLARSIEQDTLNCLAWLIADDVLQFRFAVSRSAEDRGKYHDKVAVFTDAAGDSVAIHGSFNDSVQGTLNGEAFSVFRSWDEGQRPFVRMHDERLTSLWEGCNRQFAVYGIPEAVRDQFIELRSSSNRPYSLPRRSEKTALVFPDGPECPFALRPYQQDAITKWRDQGCRGILEMATGTGKTMTALAAAVEEHERRGRLAVVILVPYIHLLEQWQNVCEQFGFLPVLCSGQHPGWRTQATSLLQDFRVGAVSHCCLLAVHNTAASESFGQVAAHFVKENTLLIGDEVHALGSRVLNRALVPQASLRLGLSATPRRWYDEQGTQILMSYFGGVCFELTLKEAIGQFLVEYEYHPLLVSLSDSEEDEYRQLSERLVSLQGRAKDEPEIEEAMKKLLIQRARVVTSAEGKVPVLMKYIRRLAEMKRQEGEQLQHTLVYCAPGTHSHVLSSLASLGIRCHEFVHTVSMKRRAEVLREFAAGHTQVLVAVKCLDEGVDVPSTETAFFLASTTNPREFVQRRGRILRRAEGKERAMIYDFVVVPRGDDIGLARSLLKREMPRFAEFASAACNEFEARSRIRDVLDQYGMLHLLDEMPWDVYKEQLAANELLRE
jgi:superfamily II DNA or RNA helicase